jgi:hypothetical protein
MPRIWQLRSGEGRTPFANLLTDYMLRHGFYTNLEFAEHLGVHRNTLNGWIRHGYLPDRDHLHLVVTKLDDFWRAVGLETSPRPRPQPLWQDQQRVEESAFADHIRRIQRDPRLSARSKEAMIALLQQVADGNERLHRQIIAEHVVESVASGDQGAPPRKPVTNTPPRDDGARPDATTAPLSEQDRR